MKIKVTVNLGNYENISVESSECIEERDCEDEIIRVLDRYQEPRVQDFISRLFKRRP